MGLPLALEVSLLGGDAFLEKKKRSSMCPMEKSLEIFHIASPTGSRDTSTNSNARKLNSPTNMKNTTVKSFADFLEHVCSDTFNGYLFRGVPDVAAHTLVPSIGRLPKFHKATRAKITTEEKHWLKRFRLEGARHLNGSPTAWDWMVLARHHGLPVRLMDWTSASSDKYWTY